ncbi:hypothetical protein Pcinc_036681 [Petrolisthes cinctipes]|uniref:Selenoprotein W n=1 Tax=Petrolisthes cinctipes TaxID=88211 RepID=A0AAE1BUJ2_PETCI|nr:hypothetical protein Pcinc_036681 [Petrolisthes cinctipes]
MAGYGSKFRKLAEQLEAEFPNKLDISSMATPNVTGYFEVNVADKLVHSKKNGDGYVDSEKKYNKIVDAIHDALGD